MTADSSTEIPDRGRRLRCGHPLQHGTGVAGHPWARHLTRTIPPIWAAILVVVAGVWNALNRVTVAPTWPAVAALRVS